MEEKKNIVYHIYQDGKFESVVEAPNDSNMDEYIKGLGEGFTWIRADDDE